MSKILPVNKDVSWVGVLDYDLITFDIVMETKYGTTYNSYFINANKKTIIDTVKESFIDEYLEKLKSLTDLAEIEYIVVNHTEPDHSGCVKHLMKLCPKAKVVGSRQAINYLTEMIEFPFGHQVVKDGEILDLGNKHLRIIGAANLHWPDTIYTYLEEDKVLFTCDSFGAHYCREEMFDDEVPEYNDAFKYYFDVILKPFSKFLLKAIQKVSELDINAVCPGHGPILRSTWNEKLKISEKYAGEYLQITNPENKNILITYVSAYGYTKEMARAIAEVLNQHPLYSVDMVDIEHISLGELEEKIVGCNAIMVGSPTINQNTLLPIYKMFALINPIRDRGKAAAVFGSFGWSGEAVKLIENHLSALKLNVIQEGLSARFYPYNDKLDKVNEFANRFVALMEEK